MEQSPSLQADSSSASQEIPRILLNKTFITGGTISHQLSLSWTMSVQFTYTTPYFLMIVLKLSCSLRVVFTSGLRLSHFPIQNLYAPLPYVQNIPLTSFFLILSPK